MKKLIVLSVVGVIAAPVAWLCWEYYTAPERERQRKNTQLSGRVN